MNKSLIVLLVCLIPPGVTAQSDIGAREKGERIAQETHSRDQGWGNSTALMQMELVNKRGDRSQRALRIQSLEVEGDGDKSLTVFDQPRDVKGTAFLSFSHSVEPDQQWLFLPALKRVKRISSANKSGPFMGSEFAFEDLTSFEIEKYDFEYLRDEVVNAQDCFVIKYFPKYEHSGYTYQEVWIDKTEYRVQQIVFYDRKSALLKTLTFLEYQQFVEKYWRAMMMTMENHQTGKRTVLTWRDFEFNVGLSDSDFNSNSLKRAR
jgi:outer membrane lipoprotein-sorting protein